MQGSDPHRSLPAAMPDLRMVYRRKETEMSWAWTRTFYAKSPAGAIYNFEAKAQRDKAVKELGWEKLPAAEAYKSGYLNINRIDYYRFDNWMKRAKKQQAAQEGPIMPTNKELAEREIIDKIKLVAGGITHSSKRDTDLMIAQTVQALAAAYKDLKATPENIEEDTDTDGQQTHQ